MKDESWGHLIGTTIAIGMIVGLARWAGHSWPDAFLSAAFWAEIQGIRILLIRRTHGQ